MENIIKKCKTTINDNTYYKLKELLFLIDKENIDNEYDKELIMINNDEYVKQETLYKILLNSKITFINENMIELLCNLNFEEIEFNKKMKDIYDNYMLMSQKESNRHKEVMKDKDIILKDKDIELKKIELEILKISK
jgi:hypothetical protein